MKCNNSSTGGSTAKMLASLVILGLFLWIGVAIFRHASGRPPVDTRDSDALNPIVQNVSRDGTAVAVMVDVSGSMADQVKDTDNQTRRKIEIARRVAMKTCGDMSLYAATVTNAAFSAGLFAFSSHVQPVVAMGSMNMSVVSNAVRNMTPQGSTAIGHALARAQKELANSGLNRQFVIVVTDGQNTAGQKPERTIQGWNILPQDKRPAVYVIAFDVSGSVFNAVKALGVTVVEARDAGELQAVMDKIMFEDILVEAPTTKKK